MADWMVLEVVTGKQNARCLEGEREGVPRGYSVQTPLKQETDLQDCQVSATQ